MPNNYSLIYSPISRLDLIDILDFIAADNPDAAIDQINHIEDRIKTLSLHPLSGSLPEDPQLRIKGYRHLMIDNYVVFYKSDESSNRIYIHRVLSGYQDYSSHLD